MRTTKLRAMRACLKDVPLTRAKGRIDETKIFTLEKTEGFMRNAPKTLATNTLGTTDEEEEGATRTMRWLGKALA